MLFSGDRSHGIISSFPPVIKTLCSRLLNPILRSITQKIFILISFATKASGYACPALRQSNNCIGKGVIILLHGVPGVGKTSMAGEQIFYDQRARITDMIVEECAIESNGRPLLPITCGKY